MLAYKQLIEAYTGTIYDASTGKHIEADQLKRCIEETIVQLRGHVSPHEKVSLVFSSGSLFIICFFALMELNAVPLLLSKHATGFEVRGWLIGLSGSGKSTLAWELDKQLYMRGMPEAGSERAV
jgi:acyl-CoA synthetase (AMP-forming)/AMP-acid ligase II